MGPGPRPMGPLARAKKKVAHNPGRSVPPRQTGATFFFAQAKGHSFCPDQRAHGPWARAHGLLWCITILIRLYSILLYYFIYVIYYYIFSYIILYYILLYFIYIYIYIYIGPNFIKISYFTTIFNIKCPHSYQHSWEYHIIVQDPNG